MGTDVRNIFCVSVSMSQCTFNLARYQLEDNDHQYAPFDDEDGAHQ
jgi:hypothetical protein